MNVESEAHSDFSLRVDNSLRLISELSCLGREYRITEKDLIQGTLGNSRIKSCRVEEKEEMLAGGGTGSQGCLTLVLSGSF